MPLGADFDEVGVGPLLLHAHIVSLFCRVIDVRLDPVWVEGVYDAPHEAPVRESPQVHLLCRQILAESGVRPDQRPDMAARILGQPIPNALTDADLVRVQRRLGFFEDCLKKVHPAVFLGGQPHIACSFGQTLATYSVQ